MDRIIILAATLLLGTAAAAQSTTDPTPSPAPAPNPKAEAREQRAAERVKLKRHTKEGRTLSVARAFDPEGRKHWRRMNRRSTRAAKNCPPGTVAVR